MYQFEFFCEVISLEASKPLPGPTLFLGYQSSSRYKPIETVATPTRARLHTVQLDYVVVLIAIKQT